MGREIDLGLFYHLHFIFGPSDFLAEAHRVHVYVNWTDVLILLFDNYRSPQENDFTEKFYKGIKDFIMKDSAFPQLLVLKVLCSPC